MRFKYYIRVYFFNILVRCKVVTLSLIVSATDLTHLHHNDSTFSLILFLVLV